ncbi:MAG: hypothetical protein M3A44_06630 [Gammaproteobacteria bacterium]
MTKKAAAGIEGHPETGQLQGPSNEKKTKFTNAGKFGLASRQGFTLKKHIFYAGERNIAHSKFRAIKMPFT